MRLFRNGEPNLMLNRWSNLMPTATGHTASPTCRRRIKTANTSSIRWRSLGAGYETSYDDALNITNTLETTKVKVVKAWQDEEDRHGIRPDSITVQLYRDDEKYEEPVKITANGGWTYEWTDLPNTRTAVTN